MTIHQGWIEWIRDTDLLRYSERGIQRNTKLAIVIDEDGDAEFPVLAEIGTKGHRRTVRRKNLMGADGASLAVRRCMRFTLEGESLDHIWDVVDLVVDTEYFAISEDARLVTP